MAEDSPKEERIKSDFSMGALDFERYNKLLEEINSVEVQVNAGNYQLFEKYKGLLRTLFNEWESYLPKKRREEIRNLFAKVAKCEETANKIRPFPSFYTFEPSTTLEINVHLMNLRQRALEHLWEIRIKLFEARKEVGFGMKVTPVLDEGKKLKRGFLLDD